MTGAVLAGGHSRRMGTDKALLPWHGQPLWARQAALLRAVGADPVAVIRRPDQSAVSDRCWRDQRAEGGPLAGLETALEHCPAGDTLAVLAVDMPFLEADWFHWLLAAERPGAGVVAQHPAAFEPLAAIYPAAALPEVRARLDRKELSLQALIRKLVADGLMYARVLPDNRLLAARSLNFMA